MFEQLREKQRALGDTHGEQNTALLAEVEYARGRKHRAAEILKETLPAVRAGADRVLLVNLLVNLPGYVAEDDLTGAAAVAREALAIGSELELQHPQVALAIEQIAFVSAKRGDLARAGVLKAMPMPRFSHTSSCTTSRHRQRRRTDASQHSYARRSCRKSWHALAQGVPHSRPRMRSRSRWTKPRVEIALHALVAGSGFRACRGEAAAHHDRGAQPAVPSK